MHSKTGNISSICWTSENSFSLANKKGMFDLFDSRCSFSTSRSINKKQTSLGKINISKFCKENNIIAFGGNESKVLLFDIRNIKECYKDYTTMCSRKYEYFN